MTIIPYGDSSLLIKFEGGIDPKISKKVIALSNAIENSGIEGISFVTPAYNSLAVGYNPNTLNFTELSKKIQSIKPGKFKDDKKQHLTVPVCYSREFALDKSEIMGSTGMNWDQVVEHHTSISYRVYMLGFLPGFVYLGKVPEELFVPRKEVPRITVPALSVGLAGYQTGIYPSDAPGGWQIIGKTPIRIFDNREKQPFLFNPGMTVSFTSINKSEFEKLLAQVDEGSFKREQLYESD